MAFCCCQIWFIVGWSSHSAGFDGLGPHQAYSYYDYCSQAQRETQKESACNLAHFTRALGHVKDQMSRGDLPSPGLSSSRFSLDVFPRSRVCLSHPSLVRITHFGPQLTSDRLWPHPFASSTSPHHTSYFFSSLRAGCSHTAPLSCTGSRRCASVRAVSLHLSTRARPARSRNTHSGPGLRASGVQSWERSALGTSATLKLRLAHPPFWLPCCPALLVLLSISSPLPLHSTFPPISHS
jgi:hypothetical protein